jgi:UDP-N-acetylmuramoylalanine--D-glutamate ligase
MPESIIAWMYWRRPAGSCGIALAGATVTEKQSSSMFTSQTALLSLLQPLIWIAGGADKKLSFESLAATAATHAQHIVLLQGTATALLHDALVRHGAGDRIIGTFDSFEAGIRAAQALPLRPATIALSPGCASFGMFRNEFHRGEEFRRIVTQIIAEAGQ